MVMTCVLQQGEYLMNLFKVALVTFIVYNVCNGLTYSYTPPKQYIQPPSYEELQSYNNELVEDYCNGDTSQITR